MNVVRRVIGTLFIVVAIGGVVAVERHQHAVAEGAASATGVASGFPQVASGNRISTSWFCPGAAGGDGIDSASVVLSNPSDSEITASVSYLSDQPQESKNVVVAARSRLVVDALRGRTIGVVVPVVEIIGSVGTVEQNIVFAAGDVTSQCVSHTSSSWYFADGFTAEGSSERLVLTNPFPESAVANISFTTAEGSRTPANLQGVILAPHSAKSISINEVGAQNESVVALNVQATSGQIVASRIQHYLGGGRLGYSATVGIPSPQRDWWFTSGRTGSTVTEKLVAYNPTDEDAQVTVTFFGVGITNGIDADKASAAASPSSAVTIPAGGVVAIRTDDIADLPKGDHAMLVSSLANAHVVVEHVLSQITGGSSFTAITNGIPGDLTSTRWRVPSGLANGARNALTILNTTAVDGTITISAVGPGGEVPLPNLKDIPIGAASVISLDVPLGATDGEVVVTATVEVAIQRRTTRGHGLVGFGIVGALPVRQK
jgi:hypothetical protein